MGRIWYLLKCPEMDRNDCVEKYQKYVNGSTLQEVLYFQCQKMMRYGGQWHLEQRAILPGCVFLSGTKNIVLKQVKTKDGEGVSLNPCKTPYLKTLCSEGALVEMSKGIIKNGILTVTNGPLQGKEQLIRKIDRHKRIAEIGIPFEDREQRVTVGLEIYEKRR